MAKKENDILTVQELQELIDKNNFSPLYYFFGDNDYLIEEYTKLIIQKNVDKATECFNLDIIDTTNIRMRDLMGIVSAYPMNSERRVVVVKQFKKILTSDNNVNLIRRYVENPLETTILIMIGEKLDMRTSFAQLLKNKSVMVEFKTLYDNQVPEWIKKRAKYFGKNITDSAANLLAEYVGNSMREINSELEKLNLYIEDKNKIDFEDVVAVVGMSKAFNIFALQKAVGEKKISEAIFILENLLARGESPIGIVAILSKFFHKLWVIKSTNLTSPMIVKFLNMQKFAADEYERFASNFTINEIENAIILLLKADQSLKSSFSDERLIMTILVYELLNANI